MTDKITCEIYLAIDEAGNYEVGRKDYHAAKRLEEELGGGVCLRIVKITAKIATPKISEIELDVSDEAGRTEEIEAKAE